MTKPYSKDSSNTSSIERSNMITYFMGDHVSSHGMKVPRKYTRMITHILVECGGIFIQEPSYEGDTMTLEGIRFHNSKQYHEFERRVAILTTDVVEVRSDTRKNYLKNRIKAFFRNIFNKQGAN